MIVVPYQSDSDNEASQSDFSDGNDAGGNYSTEEMEEKKSNPSKKLPCTVPHRN